MLEIGQTAPDFTLPGIDGRTYRLQDLLHGHRAVAVIFSCNHCPYVQAWEDRMIALQREYGERGVVLVAINPNDATRYPEDSFEGMRRRAQQKGFNFLYLHDESQDVARAYGAERTPHVYLLDGQGVLRYRGAIDDNYERPEAVRHTYLRDAIEAVLSGTKPPVETTPAVGCTIKWRS